jgi:hypothetical protein
MFRAASVSSPSPRRRFLVCGAAVLAVLTTGGELRAQFGGFGGGGFGGGGRFGGFGGVGGISVDTDGIVRTLDAKAQETLAAERRAALAKNDAMAGKAEFRKVSLARLAAVVDRAAREGTPLSPEALFLGGLQRITHVFVDPDGHDIILAGPADAIVIDAAGNPIGAASRRPPLLLEDFIVALRAIDGARQGGIRCSIDPRPEGLAALQTFLRAQGTMGPDPDATLRGMEQAVGRQTVTVGGVPGASRFARVLVAADYRMKRIGMGLEPSGVTGLPSYLAMVPAGATASSLPRFWLEPVYEPLSRDPDELAWRINGRRMKCLSESDRLAKDGVQRGKGAADATAVKWCDAMTARYDDLAARQPIFADLVNCIDLAVVAALIDGRQLDRRAGLDLAVFRDGGRLPLPAYDVPTSVPTVASGMKKGSKWVVTASGGVQCQPWAFAAETAEATGLADTRTASVTARPADAWFWE